MSQEWCGTVYQCLNCDYHYVPENGPKCCPKCKSHDHEQTGEVRDPAQFIEDLINTDDPYSMTEGLMGDPHCCVCKGKSSLGCGDSKDFKHYCMPCFNKTFRERHEEQKRIKQAKKPRGLLQRLFATR